MTIIKGGDRRPRITRNDDTVIRNSGAPAVYSDLRERRAAARVLPFTLLCGNNNSRQLKIPLRGCHSYSLLA